METLYSILSTIILVVIVAFILIMYVTIQNLKIRRKFSKFVDFCNLFNYNFADYFTYEGKGLIYRKQVSAIKINADLRLFGMSECNIPPETIVFENISIVEFPYWEERIVESTFVIVKRHGGIRLKLFYNLEVKEGEKYLQRPYRLYINQNSGTYFSNIILIDGDFLQGVISQQKKFALEDFIDEEVRYWNCRSMLRQQS